MEEVKKKSGILLSSVNSSIEWADQHGDDIVKKGVINALKSIRRRVKTINEASQKRPSVAIFGQSQVGKSYLVQNLTKPEDSKFLQIDIEGHSIYNQG